MGLKIVRGPRRVMGLFVLGSVMVACSSDADAINPATPSSSAPGDANATSPPPASSTADPAGANSGSCVGKTDYCVAWNVRKRCTPSAWVEEACQGGCFAGQCMPDACSDECALGESATGKTCRLFDITKNAMVDADPSTSLHDRARAYTARLRKHHLPSGGVVQGRYTDKTYSAIATYDGVADSAIWSGTALASEGFRMIATGSADAAKRITEMADTLHTWLNVTGAPGYLARYAAPTTASSPGIQWSCSSFGVHCNAPYAGATYNWRGDTSRDQYSGYMLGQWLAYEAMPDEAVRAKLRSNVVTVVTELMKVRKGVPARTIVNGISFDTTLDLENVIMPPASEQKDGKVTIEVDTSDLSNGGSIDGVREFVPDYSMILKQLPLVGAAVPPIDRPGSAAMLGAFFRMALKMTENVPEAASQRAAIESYYNAHADGWIDVAKRYNYLNECGAKYYGIHIEYIAAYAWSMLETSPARLAGVRDATLDKVMWTELVSGHKNAYFAFLWAGTRPTKPDVSPFVTQLAQFPAPPRTYRAVDVRAKYPHDSSCKTGGEPQAAKSTAVDVGDRVVSDFLWQRHPWGLFAGGDELLVAPGVDYLAAYWAARRHEITKDDHAHTCTRWMP
jgi:hypothetical protein